MKILLTTPAGQIGREVLRELLAPEFELRVITRHPECLPEDILTAVEVIQGATDDAATLRRALAGIDALFWCVPGAPMDVTDLRGYYKRFAQAAREAVRAARTPRVVSISAVGKGLARNAGPISALHEMEEALNKSGASIRHVRCGIFMENVLRQARAIAELGMLSYPIDGDVSLPLSAVSDIAEVVLRWLVRRDWSGIDAVAAHGPEDISFNRAAAELERVLDRPVRFREVSANQYLKGLVEAGASVEMGRELVNMFAELGAGIASAEPRTYETTTSTRFAEWIETRLRSHVEELAVTAPTGACNCRCEV